MAIVNTLERCLDSPYLLKDESAALDVPALLSRARARLDDARALLEGGERAQLNDASQFAYESMFAALRACVYGQGYRERGLRCLMIAFEALMVAPGRIEEGHVRAFVKAQSQTLLPADAVEAAERFLEAAERQLGDSAAAAPPANRTLGSG